MNSTKALTKRERILGGLWGSVVGDALGVPVEFVNRGERKMDPVTGMRAHGTHNQPAGTWSDDSSLLLCSTESLVLHEFDTQDMGKRFVRWSRSKLWTPHGKIFDMGITTSSALGRIAEGMRAEVAGGDSESSNGNGSLMRILPVSLRFANAPTKQLLDRAHRVSAITHRHPRSQMACGFHALLVREFLNGLQAQEALRRAVEGFRSYYDASPFWSVELDNFQPLLAGNLADCPETEIESSGYVLHTLFASVWCLLNTKTFDECVLKAVNLGGDTDTTGCVAGGLAGVLYGFDAIPNNWLQVIARREDIERLFNRFCETTDQTRAVS